MESESEIKYELSINVWNTFAFNMEDAFWLRSQQYSSTVEPVAAGDRSTGCARLTLSLIFALPRENGCNHCFFSQIFVNFRANARKSTKISEKKESCAHPDERSGAAAV